ncbi:MAG: PEP-CTERM sorting domain-containing protein [Phycisphaeraceae bacterium]|nr:PEP-CTERM sorting domain-containing protein [Phycisphaeraceae bacterium]
MNNTIRVFRRTLLLGVLSVICATAGANPFVNLDFEGDASQPGYVPFPNDPLFFEDFLDWALQANPVDPSYGQLYLTYYSTQGPFPLLWNVPGQPTADNPLPGWTSTYEEEGWPSASSPILLNMSVTLNIPELVVIEGQPEPWSYWPAPIDGNYSLWIWSGGVVEWGSSNGPPYYFSRYSAMHIMQTGDVPADALSLRFRYEIDDAPTDISVTLGGVSIALVEVEPGVLGGDISALAGLTDQELVLTSETVLYQSDPNEYYGPSWVFGSRVLIDDIEFSPLPIPEPATVSLLALGVLLGYRRRLHS